MRDHTIELLKGCGAQPFSYDQASGLFRSGGQEFTPEELPFRHFGTDSDTADLANMPFVQTYMRPIMLPRLYDWLQDNLRDELAEETAATMREVYLRLHPDMASHRKALERDRSGFMGFNMMRVHQDHPHIYLTTLGNCACFGVGVDGLFGQREWDEKLASFNFHNVDTPAQRVSLLAGIGHIAHKALND